MIKERVKAQGSGRKAQGKILIMNYEFYVSRQQFRMLTINSKFSMGTDF